MNNKGRGTGIALLLFLIAALIVAFLAVTQMGSLKGTSLSQGNDLVRQAQDDVVLFVFGDLVDDVLLVAVQHRRKLRGRQPRVLFQQGQQLVHRDIPPWEW